MEEKLFRIIIVGDSSVGKSCILLKFTEGIFKDSHEVTIGVELGNKVHKVDDLNVKFQIWDTSGQENYRSVTRSFYRRANCALLVFDVTNKESFTNCDFWIREIKMNSKEDVVIYLVGNKFDMDQSEVNQWEAIEYASKHGISGYIETSAKSGHNIDYLFEVVGQKLLSQDKTSSGDSGKFEIQIVKNTQKKKCCKN